jgi:hypothetical protein
MPMQVSETDAGPPGALIVDDVMRRRFWPVALDFDLELTPYSGRCVPDSEAYLEYYGPADYILHV